MSANHLAGNGERILDRRVIGVFPSGEHFSRLRLLKVLEGAFPVRFVHREVGEWRGLHGAIFINQRRGVAERVANNGIPTLVASTASESGSIRGGGSVLFGKTAEIDRCLRGRLLNDHAASHAAPIPKLEGDTLIGSGPHGPVWVMHEFGCARLHHVSLAPAELGEHERLKDHLRAGRFLALLPLVQFLREIVGAAAWEVPGPRASFVLDDPNLHWTSYGYLRYPDLATHAEAHGYHVGIAMVPIDALFAHARVVSLFRQHPQLSLLIHGNNHLKRELARQLTTEDSVALAAQALRRMSAFERRSGVSVCRVMVPPHYVCSEEMMVALLVTGFEAICYWGPIGSGSSHALMGWAPADLHVGGGLPGLHRLAWDASPDEVRLRAFLKQPLILFGHHTDLVRNLDVLAEATSNVNELGDVRWLSVTDIARSNFFHQEQGDLLRIRAFSRKIDVDVPEAVRRVVVEMPEASSPGEETVTVRPVDGSAGTAVTGSVGEALTTPNSSRLEIALSRREFVDPAEAPHPSPRLWPIVRRCLTEGRDRVLPLFGIRWSQRL